MYIWYLQRSPRHWRSVVVDMEKHADIGAKKPRFSVPICVQPQACVKPLGSHFSSLGWEEGLSAKQNNP